MHILFIADGDSKYGSQQSMKQLIKELISEYEDIEISVVLPLRVNLADYYRQLGCRTYRILYDQFYQSITDYKWKMPAKFVIRGTQYLFGRCFAVHCLSKKIDMSTIDIIHSNSLREDFGAELALKYKKPFVWHLREFGDKDFKCFSFRRNYIELMNTTALKFITVSDAVKEHWIKKRLNREKVIRIYDGVITKVNVKEEYRKKENDKIKFLMIGGVNETKGQYQVIQACGLMTKEEKEKITLDIIGGGSKLYIKKLNKMIKKYGLTASVHILGYKKNAWENISSYDCGLMCSKSEAFGRVTIEYMMAGIPVIASDTGANKELVIDNENGLLYRWNNVMNLKEKIVYILNHVDALEKMGKAARDYAQSNFPIKLNAELVYKEYLKIMENSTN